MEAFRDAFFGAAAVPKAYFGALAPPDLGTRVAAGDDEDPRARLLRAIRVRSNYVAANVVIGGYVTVGERPKDSVSLGGEAAEEGQGSTAS